jgi:hypothetical protein
MAARASSSLLKGRSISVRPSAGRPRAEQTRLAALGKYPIAWASNTRERRRARSAVRFILLLAALISAEARLRLRASTSVLIHRKLPAVCPFTAINRTTGASCPLLSQSAGPTVSS